MEKRSALVSVFVHVEKNCTHWFRLLEDFKKVKIPLEIFWLSTAPIASEASRAALESLNAVHKSEWLSVNSNRYLEALLEGSSVGLGVHVLCLRSRHRLFYPALLRSDVEKLLRRPRLLVAYQAKFLLPSFRQRFLKRVQQLLHYRLLGLVDQDNGILMHAFTFRRLKQHVQRDLKQTRHFEHEFLGLAAKRETLKTYFRSNALGFKALETRPKLLFMGDLLETFEHFLDLALDLYGRRRAKTTKDTPAEAVR